MSMRNLVAAAGVMVFVLAACVTKDSRTQITIALASETAVPTELDRLQVRVMDAKGSVTYLNDYDVVDPTFFPTTLAVIPADEESFDGPVRIELLGYGANGGVRLQRTAILAYSRGRNLLLPMPLRMACVNFQECGANRTCRGGQCVNATVEASALRDYSGDQVFAGREGPCFDEAACVALSTQVGVDADCTFAMPSDGNVGLVWAAAPTRLLVLEPGDPEEGWSRMEGGRGLLSPGACLSLLDPEVDPAKRQVPDRALALRISSACSAKPADVPFCVAPDGHSGIGAPL